MLRKIRWITALCLAGALLLLGSALRVPDAAAKSGVTITIVRGVDVETGDPLNDTVAPSLSVYQNLFDPLVRVNWENTAEILPALASSWEFLSPTKIRFHLRQGVKFHNGQPFTAEDVKFTFDRVLNKQKPTRISPWLVSIIKGVTIENDQTVILETERPYAPILSRLAIATIMPKKTFEQMGAEAFGQKPIGTGPYKLTEWKKGQYMRFEANESWWGWTERDRNPDVVIRRAVGEDFTRYAMLKSGEADLVGQISPDRVKELQETPGLRVLTVPSTRGFFVGMNTNVAPFNNVKVRQAMNYAVDAKLIVDTVLGGQAQAHTGVCSINEFGYCPTCKGYGYNPEKAKELLKEAGYPNGFKVRFWSPRGRYMKDLEVSEAIAGQLEAVGIKVEVYAPAWSEFWDNWLAKKHEMYYLSYGGSVPDCDDRIGGHLDSKRRGLYYNSPESDKLITEEQSTVDPKKRLAVFNDLSQYFIDQAPWIFLYDQNMIYGVSSRIKKWPPSPMEYIFFWQIEVK
jgi:peptide/nickel transport system substrate-binding protein